MTQYSFKDDDEGIDYVIGRLIDMLARLSSWEATFIHNIEHKRKTYRGGYLLSDRQKQIISDIWEKY